MRRDNESTTSRRRMLQIALATSGASILGMRVALALEPLKTTETTAKALAYVENVADLSPSEARKEGAICRNCRLYGAETDGRGPCSIFPGKSVAGDGWCRAWVPKG